MMFAVEEVVVEAEMAEIEEFVAEIEMEEVENVVFAEVEMVENPAKAGEGYRKLARAALAHRKKLMELMFMYPEDAKPVAVELMNYSRRVYDMSALKIREAGELPPENPFDSPH